MSTVSPLNFVFLSPFSNPFLPSDLSQGVKNELVNEFDDSHFGVVAATVIQTINPRISAALT